MRIKYHKSYKTLEDLRKEYRKLANEHHPDRGGSTAIMQIINIEYEYLLRNANFEKKLATEEEQNNGMKYRDIIEKLMKIPQIKIEIIGSWVWVSGNTYPVKNQLKQAGLLFSGTKKMWYYREETGENSKSKPKSMEEIKRKYGIEQTIITPIEDIQCKLN